MEAATSSNMLIMNAQKREYFRKQHAAKKSQEMRATLPVLTMEEIRFHKMPFHEALLMCLEERGYTSTVSFIKEIFDYQDSARDEAGPTNLLFHMPILRECQQELLALSDGLCESEEYHVFGNNEMECETFLKLAVGFAFSDPNFWWLGLLLIVELMKVCKNYPKIEQKYDAFCNFIYGKFLMENYEDYSEAINHLYRARTLSLNKFWVLKRIFPELRSHLYIHVNELLHICLLEEAKKLIGEDYEKAKSLAEQSRKRAAQACDVNGESEALIIKAVCEIGMQETKAAICTLHIALNIQSRLKSIDGMCKVRVVLAKAYIADKDNKNALDVLLTINTVAEENELLVYQGQACRMLGEIYLNSGQPAKAKTVLNKACINFRRVKSSFKNVTFLRNLRDLSRGLELFPYYLEHLDRLSPGNPLHRESFNKLISWKDSREPFWPDNVEFHFIAEGSSCHEDIGKKLLGRKQPDTENRSSSQNVKMKMSASFPKPIQLY